MQSKRLSSSILGGILLVNSLPAIAIDFKYNGFLTVGTHVSDVKERVLDSTGNMVLPAYNPSFSGGITRKPNTNYDTLLGLQIEGKFNDKLSVVSQFVAPGYNSYQVEASWAFARYKFNDNVVGRAGRLRNPTFLVSEYLQVGYAYPWITPPNDVYNQIPIAFANITGADLTYTTPFLKQDLSITAFAGSAVHDTAENGLVALTDPINIPTTYNTKGRNILGVTANMGNEILNVKGSYSSAKVSLLSNSFQQMALVDPAVASRLKVEDKWFNAISIGYKLEWKQIYSMGEYSRLRYSGWLPDSYGWFGTLGYRIQEKWLPTVTYSRFKTTRRNALDFFNLGPADALRQGVINNLYTAEDSLIVALRYDVADNLALKASWTQVTPKLNTQGLFDNKPVKHKANLFGLALNLVF